MTTPLTPEEAVGTRERRFEPWPWVVIGLLGFMISGSLTFYSIAANNPDPEVVEDAFAASERIARAAASVDREAR